MIKESNVIRGLGSLLFETIEEWIKILAFFVIVIFMGYILLAMFHFAQANSYYIEELNYNVSLFVQEHALLVLIMLSIMAFMTVRQVRIMRRRKYK